MIENFEIQDLVIDELQERRQNLGSKVVKGDINVIGLVIGFLGRFIYQVKREFRGKLGL